MEVTYEAKERITIPTGARPQERALSLPCFRKEEGKILCMRFEACLYRPSPAGWNPWLGIILNGKSLGKYTAAQEERLLGRGPFCETIIYSTITYNKDWWGKSDEGMPVLLTFHGPGGDAVDKRVVKPREEGYWYLLDISDTANHAEPGAADKPASSKANILTFVNTFPKVYVTGGQAPDMRINSLSIGYLPEERRRRP